MVTSIKPVTQGILNQLQKTVKKEDTELKKLATGKKNPDAAGDIVALLKTETITAGLRGLEQADANITNANALLGTAESGLESMLSQLGELSALSVQAADDLLSPQERQSLNARATDLLSQLDDTARSTGFNGRALLDGSFGTRAIQAGAAEGDTIDITLGSATNAALGTDAVNLGNAEAAGDAITTVNAAILTVASELAEIGSTQQRLDTAQTTGASSQETMSAAKSAIADADVAAVVMKLKSLQLQKAAQTVILESSAKTKKI